MNVYFLLVEDKDIFIANTIAVDGGLIICGINLVFHNNTAPSFVSYEYFFYEINKVIKNRLPLILSGCFSSINIKLGHLRTDSHKINGYHNKVLPWEEMNHLRCIDVKTMKLPPTLLVVASGLMSFWNMQGVID